MTTATRHFLDDPGDHRGPVEFYEDDEGSDTECSACGTTRDEDYRILHDARCPAARIAVDRSGIDVVEDDSTPDPTQSIRRRLAEDYAVTALSSIDLRETTFRISGNALRAATVAAYIAGYARARTSATDAMRSWSEVMPSEIDARSGSR